MFRLRLTLAAALACGAAPVHAADAAADADAGGDKREIVVTGKHL